MVQGVGSRGTQTTASVRYQPVVDLHTGETVAVEALLRGTVHGQPAGPRAVLEQLRLEGVDVPGLVLGHVVAAMERWDAASDRRVDVSFNVDAVDVECSDVAEAIDRASHRVCPTRLVAEITEIQAVDPERAADVLAHLRGRGVRLAVDDFGVAESTLQQLERVQPDVIKIDRSFVTPLGVSGGDRGMVEVTLALARRARLKVIAEGVETVAQLVALRRLGCRYVQGHLFARAMAAEEIERLLLAGAAVKAST